MLGYFIYFFHIIFGLYLDAQNKKKEEKKIIISLARSSDKNSSGRVIRGGFMADHSHK